MACEKGTVTVVRSDVSVQKAGEEEVKKSFPEEGSGVKQEVKAWGEGLVGGRLDARQSPEEALKDLKTVSVLPFFPTRCGILLTFCAQLEAMFKSGEQDGAAVDTGL